MDHLSQIESKFASHECDVELKKYSIKEWRVLQLAYTTL